MGGASREQDGPVGFGEEEQRDTGDAGEDEANPEDPAPSEGWGYETRDHGRDEGAHASCLV